MSKLTDRGKNVYDEYDCVKTRVLFKKGWTDVT